MQLNNQFLVAVAHQSVVHAAGHSSSTVLAQVLTVCHIRGPMITGHIVLLLTTITATNSIISSASYKCTAASIDASAATSTSSVDDAAASC
eukprot:8983-Heterococcus_DN1.PRE.3